VRSYWRFVLSAAMFGGRRGSGHDRGRLGEKVMLSGRLRQFAESMSSLALSYVSHKFCQILLLCRLVKLVKSFLL